MPKIIVDIDDDFYHQTLKHKRLCFEYMGTKELVDAIANGTPLDDIEADVDHYLTTQGFGTAYRQEVFDIIDRHIGERSEDAT